MSSLTIVSLPESWYFRSINSLRRTFPSSMRCAVVFLQEICTHLCEPQQIVYARARLVWALLLVTCRHSHVFLIRPECSEGHRSCETTPRRKCHRQFGGNGWVATRTPSRDQFAKLSSNFSNFHINSCRRLPFDDGFSGITLPPNTFLPTKHHQQHRPHKYLIIFPY